MKFRTYYIPLLLLVSCLSSVPGQSQINDTTIHYKNVIRLNLSNPVIFGVRNNVIGYERMLTENQSISVNIGRFSFPKFEPLLRDSLQLQKNYKDNGFHFSVDYRWYLLKENKYDAPRGFYIGPYYAYNYLKRENYWIINMSSYNGELISDLSVNMHLIGFQLGCQFFLWKRLSVDVIFMGPGLWFFDIKSKTNSVPGADESELVYQQLNELSKNKIRGYNVFLDGDEFSKKGSARTGVFGYRYLVNIGYRF